MPKHQHFNKKKHLLFRGEGTSVKAQNIIISSRDRGHSVGKLHIIKTQNIINSSRGSSVGKLFPKNIHKNNILTFQHQGQNVSPLSKPASIIVVTTKSPILFVSRKQHIFFRGRGGESCGEISHPLLRKTYLAVQNFFGRMPFLCQTNGKSSFRNPGFHGKSSLRNLFPRRLH